MTVVGDDLLTITFRLATTEDCCPGCPAFIERWGQFWAQHAAPDAPPVAIMVCENYYQQLRKKSKAMVRQANRHYRFAEFDIADHAKDVEAVNRSKTHTTYGPVYGWTAGPINPVTVPDRIHGLCGTTHQDRWFGGFDHDGVLRGYVRLIRMDTLAIIHSLFRHAENSTGVLNGLLAHIADNGDVDHVSYHTMDVADHTGRPQFKRYTGFQPARLTIIQ